MAKENKNLTNYAFIDSQNLNIGTQKTGWKIDWRKFRNYLSEKYNVKVAYLFIGYVAENENLYEYMHDLGYLVVLKRLVYSRNIDKDESKEGNDKADVEENKSNIKGNIDADLVLYSMKEIDKYDKALIVSGDGDFLSLCEYLNEENKLLGIMTPNWMYSSLFKEFENKIIRLDLLKRRLAYKKSRLKRKTQKHYI